jgi:8-oxo-dGTP diphosphatase
MGAKEQGADATQGRWLVIPRTLCFVFNGDDILMMKRGPHRRVFPNRFNGVGGHIERDEDPETGARREILEETGLTVGKLRLCGVSHIDAGADTGIVLYIYAATSDTRELTVETAEGTLQWVPKSEVLSLDLVEDLPQILPRILNPDDKTQPFSVHLSYDDQDNVQLRFANE